MPTKRPRVNLSVPPEIYAEMEAAAKAQGVSLSALVMSAIAYARPHWRRSSAMLGGNTVSGASASGPVRIDLRGDSPAKRVLTRQQQKFADRKKKA